MYSKKLITNNIYYVGVNDRTKHLFESIWEIPAGVSYNSYLIVDEKVALVDTVDACYSDLFLSNLKSVLGDRKIDYLIINHMEPDHSASISAVKYVYPDIQIVGNAKTFGMLDGFFNINENLLEVKDEDTLSLGKTVLRFYLTPMVHWIETMMTYDETNKTLFAGDAFGCFGALDGGVLDSQINIEKFWPEMVRYYANIVGKYGMPVQRALKKLSNLDIQTICSTHGPVWQKHIQKTIGIYNDLSQYKAEKGVVVLYGSMYGNTEVMAEVIADTLVASGIQNVILHNVSKSTPSYMLADIFRYQGLIIGSPTYSNELFPMVESMLSKIKNRDIKNRFFAYFGSFSWAGVATKKLAAFAEQTGFEVVYEGGVEQKFALKQEKYLECVKLAENMAERLHKEFA
ncbi:MAG: FprA family A-type flavoprotein [Paludibacteraceae bacterium]|nr:FprA family A-type flavoprotein [Paludibacteraceae bacterium]MBP6284063.1 FprA family A-type flavoprotein [Paludibacteraceae bacterium]